MTATIPSPNTPRTCANPKCGKPIEHLRLNARTCDRTCKEYAKRARTGSAHRKIRGYAPYAPKAEARETLENVEAILDEYADHLPLTLRQIFYRLVGAYGFDKSEAAYNGLGDKIARARRARMIPFESIRDDGITTAEAMAYQGLVAFHDETKLRAQRYRRDRQDGQPAYIELWCEAAGMVPQLFQVAAPYSVPVYSAGGGNSITAVWELSQRAIERDMPTIVLHLGDYDPTGEMIFEHLSEDAPAFAAEDGADDDWIQSVRVALTGEQVAAWNLPTDPPKKTDKKTPRWLAEGKGETCQLEAIPPDTIADLVRAEIEDNLDMRARQDTLEREQSERGELLSA